MNKKEFIKRIYSKEYLKKMKKKIMLLGSSNKFNVYDLILLRLLSTTILFIIILFSVKYGYIWAPIVSILYYISFNQIFINLKLMKRTTIIENEAMHFFEVLALSLETGRNLVEAIKVTTTNVSGVLSDEFKEAIREVSFGKSLNEALVDTEKRIPSEVVNNVILSLTQSDLYGNSIVEGLYTQVDYLREKRKLVVKGKISKVPIYISIVSVFFFIPLVLMIVIGPIILKYIS